MNIKIYIILIIILFANKVFPQAGKTENMFNLLAEMEYKELKSLYADCLVNPCHGDSLFFKTWLDGLENEMNNNLIKASEYYDKALHFQRFELSSYEVGFSLGRIEIRKGNINKGIEILNVYLINADKDLNPTDEYQMWGLTEEGIEKIQLKIKYAKDIIKKYK
jgi:hypothetical protein